MLAVARLVADGIGALVADHGYRLERQRRSRLVKFGANLVGHGRYVTFPLAEIAVPGNLFREIPRRIVELQAKTRSGVGRGNRRRGDKTLRGVRGDDENPSQTGSRTRSNQRDLAVIPPRRENTSSDGGHWVGLATWLHRETVSCRARSMPGSMAPLAEPSGGGMGGGPRPSAADASAAGMLPIGGLRPAYLHDSGRSSSIRIARQDRCVRRAPAYALTA